jgi:hypothetical protein
MAADQFTTDSMLYAAVLDYIFSEESLVRIDLSDSGKAQFTFCVPSLDAAAYIDEFEKGILQITDCKSLFKSHSRIFGAVRALRQRNESSWCSRGWVEGRTSDGRKIK